MYKYFISKLKTREFNNIKHLLFSYLLKYIIGLFINIWIVRALGEENFGIFSYVTSLSGIFSIISTFGLQTVVITSILNSKNKDEGLVISNSFLISVLTGMFAAILQLIFVLYYNFSEKTVLYLCLINLIIYFFDTFKILTYYYESKVESAKVAKINNISYLICTFCRIIILYKGLNFYYLAFSYVLDYIITAFLLYFTFPIEIFSLMKIRYSKKIFLNIIHQSLPFLFSGLFINFFMKIDLIMIKNLMDNKQAGIFASSVRLTEIWYFIPGLIQSTFFPSLFDSKENKTIYRMKIIKLYKLMIYFSFFIITITLIFGKVIVIKLFGTSYTEAYEPLKIHIWALLFVSISVIRNSKLFAMGLSKIFFQITLIGAILNLFLCFILIRQFGVIGASFATVLTYFVISYVLNIFYKDLRGEITNINTSFLTLFKKFNI
jgi:O-antigen/teichoic acid export membrane protein